MSDGQLIGGLHTYELEVLADDHSVSGKKGKLMAFNAKEQTELDTMMKS